MNNKFVYFLSFLFLSCVSIKSSKSLLEDYDINNLNNIVIRVFEKYELKYWELKSFDLNLDTNFIRNNRVEIEGFVAMLKRKTLDDKVSYSRAVKTSIENAKIVNRIIFRDGNNSGFYLNNFDEYLEFSFYGENWLHSRLDYAEPVFFKRVDIEPDIYEFTKRMLQLKGLELDSLTYSLKR
jgi:hypothetical protein